MDKRILKDIAKRWCKGILISNQAACSFEQTCLTEDEMQFIQDESIKIAERITSDEYSSNTDDLVNEYYELK